MCWTGEETSKAIPSNVASQISSLRDDDLASEVETDQTRQKIRKELVKFRRKLQDRVRLL